MSVEIPQHDSQSPENQTNNPITVIQEQAGAELAKSLGEFKLYLPPSASGSGTSVREQK